MLKTDAASLNALELTTLQLQSPELARVLVSLASSVGAGVEDRDTAELAGADWYSVATCSGWDAWMGEAVGMSSPGM